MSEPRPPASDWERRHARRLRLVALALVAVGLLWRLGRYLLAFPVWGDEAYLLFNYPGRGYRDLLGPIDNCQIAPLLFHAAEMAALQWLGPSELAVRLPSLLACVAALPLFWRLARLTLPPLGHALAVGVFSVSIWPATMGSLVKPYSFDLFFSLVLLVPAFRWLRRPERVGRLLVLALVAPLAMVGSYPAALVGGALALALLPAVRARRDARAWGLFALYAALLVGAFATHYLLVGARHLASPINGVTTGVGMTTYWRAGFPPSDPLRLPLWLFFAHTGEMAAYPIGAARGGSALTVLLALVALAWLWRDGRRRLVWLSLAALGLGLLAAALRKYPYGASCRLAQHLAPLYCLLAGLGAAVLILRCREDRRWRAAAVAAGLLAAVGLVGVARDVLRPYRDERARLARQTARELRARSGDEPILVLQQPPAVEPTFCWYLSQAGPRVRFERGIDWAAASRGRSVWVVVDDDKPVDESAALESLLSRGPARWRCVERRLTDLSGRKGNTDQHHCRYYHLVRRDDLTARRPPSGARGGW